MNPITQQQVVLGNQYPSVAPGVLNSSTAPDGKLWGGNVRRIMGIFQIICGVLEFAFGIAVICVPVSYYYNYYDRKDYAGWGIWNGVFAIVTGFLGFFSRKKKGMVISYMITSIIGAVLCAGCLIYAIAGALSASYNSNRATNLAMYTILCITFFTQMVISIIGASFTCGAVCSTTNQSHQIVYYTAQPLPQQYVPTPPYNMVLSQGGLTSQPTTPGANGAYGSAKI